MVNVDGSFLPTKKLGSTAWILEGKNNQAQFSGSLVPQARMSNNQPIVAN